MSERNDGGPAFPIENNVAGMHGLSPTGMSLRDYFAAKAMQSILSEWVGKGGDLLGINDEDIAAEAYQMADAMIEQRGTTK